MQNRILREERVGLNQFERFFGISLDPDIAIRALNDEGPEIGTFMLVATALLRPQKINRFLREACPPDSLVVNRSTQNSAAGFLRIYAAGNSRSPAHC